MTKKKIKDGDIIITCDKKPACYEYIARLEMLRKYRKLDKEHETAVTQYNAVVVQNKDLQKELNTVKKDLEDEISDFVSDMATCGFKYDDRPVADLDELRSSIEFLCTQFDKYKLVLNEVKEFLNEIHEESEADTYIARAYDLIIKIERVIK